jgi:hypothetical protein
LQNGRATRCERLEQAGRLLYVRFTWNKLSER